MSSLILDASHYSIWTSLFLPCLVAPLKIVLGSTTAHQLSFRIVLRTSTGDRFHAPFHFPSWIMLMLNLYAEHVIRTWTLTSRLGTDDM